MEVSDELTLEVSPESISARRASLSVHRSSWSVGHYNTEASLLTAQLRQGVKLGPEEYAEFLQKKWFRKDNGDSPGYHGRWRFYKPGSADEADLEKSFMCLRTYATSVSEDGLPEITVCSVHDGSAAFGHPQRRQQDGLQQNTFQRLLSDPYFSCSLMKLDELEEAEGLPACCFRRSVPVSGPQLEVAARVPPALPVKRGGRGDRIGEWGAQNASSATGPTAWGFEVIIEDADSRWSLGPMYSMDSLHFTSHFFVQEFGVDVNLDDAIAMEALPYKEPRPRLPASPERWMPGAWTGQLVDVAWDEDGEMVRLPPRAAIWTPPDTTRAGYKLFLYPDELYGYYPAFLPDIDGRGSSGDFYSRVRFEVGGMMPGGRLFRRCIIRYLSTGEIQSISDESYYPTS